MADKFVFDVVCSAERCRIAELELPTGKNPISDTDILSGWHPVDARYRIVDPSGEARMGRDGAALVRDGVQIVCPHCLNPALVTEPGKSQGVYLAPGSFGTGE